MEFIHEKNWRSLADAIIIQAGVDYMKTLRILDLAKGKEDKYDEWLKARSRLAEIRHFFKSKWHTSLSEVDGHRTIKTLNQAYKRFRDRGELDKIKHLDRTGPQ